ncbi:hypothetical protein A2U01_0060799, partial [Trifolium medium]|nr:hypothetical protein [Trifolium medium]
TKLELCLKLCQSKPASGEGSTASNAPPAKQEGYYPFPGTEHSI